MQSQYKCKYWSRQLIYVDDPTHPGPLSTLSPRQPCPRFGLYCHTSWAGLVREGGGGGGGGCVGGGGGGGEGRSVPWMWVSCDRTAVQLTGPATLPSTSLQSSPPLSPPAQPALTSDSGARLCRLRRTVHSSRSQIPLLCDSPSSETVR